MRRSVSIRYAPVMYYSEFFTYCQQKDADDHDGDKEICFPRKLFFQENAGKQQRDNANRGNNRSCNRTVSAQGVHISKLTCGFEYCSKDLILMLGNSTKFNFFSFHEDEQTQSEQCKGQFIAGIGYVFNGLFCYANQGRAGDVIQIEHIDEGAKGIQQSINKRHAERNNSKFFAKVLFSLGFTLVFQEANAKNTDHDICLTCTFNTWEDLDTYATHPEHVKVAQYIGKCKSARSAVDYEE